MAQFNKRILLSLCGTSPAVITETLYYLVTQKLWIPDKLVVITSSEGYRAIETELFESGVWQELLEDLDISEGQKNIFGRTQDNIRIIPTADSKTNASDIRSDRDNDATGNFIMENLRQFTENPDTKIIFSIAGGRKTMSALAALAMSMLGRDNDRLCHVLVNPPFDSQSLNPKFYYPPKTDKSHKTPDGKTVSSSEAKINLSFIPYVRLRNLFIKKHLRLPGTFLDTVNLANSLIHPENVKMPELVIKPELHFASINEIELDLSVAELALYWFLALCSKNGSPPINGAKNLAQEFNLFCNSTSSRVMPDLNNIGEKTDEQIRKILHTLSEKIKKALGNAEFLPFCLPSRGEGIYGIALPKDSIICPRNND